MWDAFVAWFQSTAGQRVVYDAVIPAIAIIVAGVIAALIARGAVRALLARADRDEVAGSVASLVEAARVRAAGSTDRAEDERIDRLRTEADIRLRLAPPKGAALAADWASLRLDAIERSGSSPVRQGAAEADEVRDRLLAWVARPGRAKRLFAEDVARLGAERDARRTKAGIARSAPPEPPSDPAAAPAPASAAPATATATAPDEQATDDATGSAAVAARLKTHKGRIENQPEPVSAREQNRRNEAARERAAAQAESAPPAADQPPSTEPVLVQRTRLESLDRSGEDARLEQSRYARTEAAPAPPAPAPPAPAAAAASAEPEAPAPAPEPAPATEAPAAVAASPAADEQPSPAQKQPVPAWLDTYDDEADVTRDIDLSKTPPPMSASAVRDRTRTGDDIVPRH